MTTQAPAFARSPLLESKTASRQLSGLRAVLYGGLTVGILDISDAIGFWFLRTGAPPMRILQSVASGLLGRETARGGGWPTALLGLLLHFFIATTVVLVYNLASRRLTVLTRHPVICGLAYGLLVYLTMYYVVVPLSNAGRGIPGMSPLPVLANNVLIHMLGVGLPSALFAARAYTRRSA
jgi:hypothetical protein